MTAGHHSLMGRASKVPLVAPLFSRHTQQYGYFTTPSINNSNPLTFGGWFRIYELSSEYSLALLCGWSQSGSWGSTHIQKAAVRFGNGNSAGAHNFSVELPSYRWMHLVATYTGSSVIVYKDGEVYQSWDTGSQTRTNNDADFRIASYNEGSLKYSSIAACNVFVANKSITQNDVTQLYAAHRLGSVGYMASDIYGAWDMTDLVGESSFPSVVGGNAMNVAVGYATVDSPWASGTVPYISPSPSGTYSGTSEPTNSGSCINTGVNPTTDTKVEIKCRVTPGAAFQQWSYLLGAQTGNDNANTFALRGDGSDRTYMPWTNYRWGHSAWHDLGVRSSWGLTPEWHVIIADRNQYSLDGVVTDTSSYSKSSSLPGIPMYLGAINRNGTSVNCIPLDIAYCKIWNGSTLVFDGTAAERNGTAGLFDSVSNSLFSSRNTSYPYSLQS